MKQTTIQFDKRKQEPVTLKRLQQVVDLIATGTQVTQAIRVAGIGSSFGKFLVQAKIIVKLEGKKVLVLKSFIGGESNFGCFLIYEGFLETHTEDEDGLLVNNNDVVVIKDNDEVGFL